MQSGYPNLFLTPIHLFCGKLYRFSLAILLRLQCSGQYRGNYIVKYHYRRNSLNKTLSTLSVQNGHHKLSLTTKTKKKRTRCQVTISNPIICTNNKRQRIQYQNVCYHIRTASMYVYFSLILSISYNLVQSDKHAR